METHFESNPLIDRLPKHLKQFIKPQVYDDYTPINQAVWRYVMRKNVDYLSKVAHSSYLEGLQKTGISIENGLSILRTTFRVFTLGFRIEKLNLI